jgi:microsomal dipeptidase-like Zn-dependent dipeptidase
MCKMTPSRCCSTSATQTTLAGSSAAALQNLVGAMRSRGFGEPLIEKVCFKKWLRVLGQAWKETE